ncbi:hypothetical protein D3C81_1697160 [compost metagenome]
MGTPPKKAPNAFAILKQAGPKEATNISASLFTELSNNKVNEGTSAKVVTPVKKVITKDTQTLSDSP